MNGTQFGVLLIGTIFLPIIPACALSFFQEISNTSFSASSLLTSTLIAYVFAFGFTLIIGVPGIILLAYLEWMRWWSVLLLGALGGFLVAFSFRGIANLQFGDVVLTVPIATFMAFLFWAFWNSAKGEQK